MQEYRARVAKQEQKLHNMIQQIMKPGWTVSKTAERSYFDGVATNGKKTVLLEYKQRNEPILSLESKGIGEMLMSLHKYIHMKDEIKAGNADDGQFVWIYPTYSKDTYEVYTLQYSKITSCKTKMIPEWTCEYDHSQGKTQVLNYLVPREFADAKYVIKQEEDGKYTIIEKQIKTN